MSCRNRRPFCNPTCARYYAMSPEQPSAVGAKLVANGGRVDLPQGVPAWARQLAELYFSGTPAAFLLHGNTYDYVRTAEGDRAQYGSLAEFLTEQLFGRWALVVH